MIEAKPNDAELTAIATWLVRAGIAGKAETDLLRYFCEKVTAAGVAVSRAVVAIDTLHPVHEGRVFRWRSDLGESEVREYGRTTGDDEAARSWRRSPFFHMLEAGLPSLHRRLGPETDEEFAIFREHREEGRTGWLALIDRFKPGAAIGDMDCIYSAWSTDAPGGFRAEEVAALERLVPALGLAIKSASLARIAETLVETYLGRDAGRRVLSGRIERGVADRIEAVLWFSDLRGYTAIAGSCAPDEVLPLLNDYAEAVISAVHEAGGDVLKLIGDGILAIFTSETCEDGPRCALAAERALRERVAAVTARRAEAGLPTTEVYLGLHAGEVFYGNIGSHERLDFTVIGPAVNEASRIAAMCRSAERDVLVSAAFREAAAASEREALVSVGRYALRGVERPQELFTVDRSVTRPAAPPECATSDADDVVSLGAGTIASL
jgi:adenylate cyclase